MLKLSALCLVSIFTVSLAACGSVEPLPRSLPTAPYISLSLADCRQYGPRIVDCQLESGTEFVRYRLGSVQQTGRLYAFGDDQRYQVAACASAPRIQKELPIHTCRIYGARSGVDAGSVLVKGATAIRLSQLLGDQEQIRYRWTPDRWSRVSN